MLERKKTAYWTVVCGKPRRNSYRKRYNKFSDALRGEAYEQHTASPGEQQYRLDRRPGL